MAFHRTPQFANINTFSPLIIFLFTSVCVYVKSCFLRKLLSKCQILKRMTSPTNVLILMKLSTLATLETVKMTTSSAANDGSFVKMTTFPFQWWKTLNYIKCVMLSNVTNPTIQHCVIIERDITGSYCSSWWSVPILRHGTCNHHGSLTRYAKSRVAYAPGMSGTFYSSPRVSDPDMHHVTCVTLCMPGSLTSGSLWSRWRGKRSRHSRRIHNPRFYVSGKRPG